jgi:hypothetical protein
MRLVLLAAASIAVSACASSAVGGAPTAPAQASADPTLERLLFAEVTNSAVRLRVASAGCTGADSFDFEVEEIRGGDGAVGYEVAFRRKRPDNCGRTVPGGERLSFPRADLGVPPGATLTIANPIGRVSG